MYEVSWLSRLFRKASKACIDCFFLCFAFEKSCVWWKWRLTKFSIKSSKCSQYFLKIYSWSRFCFSNRYHVFLNSSVKDCITYTILKFSSRNRLRSNEKSSSNFWHSLDVSWLICCDIKEFYQIWSFVYATLSRHLFDSKSSIERLSSRSRLIASNHLKKIRFFLTRFFSLFLRQSHYLFVSKYEFSF
jgi:hypothetical protein